MHKALKETGAAIAEQEPGRDMDPGPSGPSRPFETTFHRSSGWAVVAIAVVLQWVLFSAFAKRELTSAYPTGHDQATYLMQTYDTFDHILKDGLWKGLNYGLSMNPAQGQMMHLQGSVLLLFTGPSRLGALTLNFIYFALLECIAVYTLRSLTGRWSVAFVALGLLSCMQSRFLLTGGIADFRLDSIALCLYGIFVCLAIRSKVFLSKWWSLAAGAAAGMLILFRFLTALTLACVMGTFLLCICLMAWRGSREVRAAAFQRIRGLLCAGGLIVLLIGPIFWVSAESIRRYYLGQVAAHNDKVRAVEYGAVGPLKYWLFYPQSLIYEHLGSTCVILCTLIVLSVLLARRVSRSSLNWQPDPDARLAVLFLLIALVVPLAVLSLYPVRNPIVANTMSTPALGLVMAAVMGLAGTRKSVRAPFSRTLATLAVVSACFGAYTELSMAARRAPITSDPKSLRQITQLYDEIGERSEKLGWMAPRMSVDRMHDYTNVWNLVALTYERRGIYIMPELLIPKDIGSIGADEALAAVRNSDFAVITDVGSPEGRGFVFPFNTSMKEIQPQLKAEAERNLVPIRHFRAYSHGFTLYMRPSVQLEGQSAGWITSNGITLSAPGDILHERPNIQLSGTTFATEYLGKIRLRVQLETNGKPRKDEPAEIDLPTVAKSTVNYSILIKLRPNDIPLGEEPRIHLSFDKFFVPKNVGMNNDTRELVIMAPKQINLLR